MPPLLPLDSDSILVKSPEPYYTNEDVAILHDIVVHAQDLLPSLPERERLPTNALFHAYHTILPDIGIEADHDSRYARVLFKIGGTRSDGSLYEKFEAVLARMGIEIQYDQGNINEARDEANPTEAFSNHGADPLLHSGPTPAVADQDLNAHVSDSENKALESGHKDQGDGKLQRRLSSSASTANSENYVSRLDTPVTLSPENAPIFKHGLLDTQFDYGEQQEENNYGLKAWLNDGLEKHPQKAQTRLPHALNHGLNTETTLNTRPSDLIPNDGNGLLTSDIERPKHSRLLALASDDSLITKITLMQKLHTMNLTRQILFRWHHETLRLQKEKEKLESLAEGHDRRVLLRQALDSWHDRVGERQRMAETERFFAHLERRADRARDLFLMAKSLTHWAFNTSTEIQRTSAARRHILRMRYFGAWRDMTAVNDLKARRQVIQKFFSVWQKQHVVMSVNAERAVMRFTVDLVQRIFWTWFWAFCERRAPIWRADRLVGKQMVAWARVINEWRREQNAAIDHEARNLWRKTYLAWLRRADKYSIQTQQAQDFRRSSLCRKTLDVWQHESALLPRLHRLRRELELRLKSDLLKWWALHARQESHARVIDRSKIMREAWIIWNDKLRSQVLQSKISNRLVLQGLYKWALNERSLLARRVTERRMMQNSLLRLANTLQSSTARDSKHYYLAERMYAHRLSGRIIQIWRDSLQERLQHQQAALQFYRPIVLGKSLARWSGAYRQMRKARTWAVDGDFYFLASRTIKLWKEATETARREKRRIIYAHLRRKHKINLARKLFSQWYQQANSINERHRSAVEFSHSKSMVFCIEIFDKWKARIEGVTGLNLIRRRSQLEKYFNNWKSANIIRHGAELEATFYFQDHTATLCLKRWSRVCLQLRAAQHLVSEVREKHLKKTSRRMLGHWFQRSSESRSLAGPHDHDQGNMYSLLRPASSIDSGWDDNVDEWVERMNDGTTSTSIPAYLSTPSRRMPRARTMMRLPSTTPSAPLSTPVERQLRAQYSGGPLISFRRRIGRSVLSRGAAPLDLEGESRIRTDEESI